MSLEKGDYKELKAFENIFDDGRLRDLPGYAVRVLWGFIRHSNFPSGWSWVGKERLEIKAGLNRSYQLKAFYVLARKGFFSAWGYMQTKGQKGLAFQLNLAVPNQPVPTYQEIKKELRDSMSPKGRSLTLGLVLANLGTQIGQPWDSFKIEECITLKNPKEPVSLIESKTVSKIGLIQELIAQYPEHKAQIEFDWEHYVKRMNENPDSVYFKIKKILLRGDYVLKE